MAAGGSSAAGSAALRLDSIAKTGSDSYIPHEQVWNENPSSCTGAACDYPQGEGTFSATPLAWTHAQVVRLAWFIQDGKPVERSSIVYDHFVRSAAQVEG